MTDPQPPKPPRPLPEESTERGGTERGRSDEMERADRANGEPDPDATDGGPGPSG